MIYWDIEGVICDESLVTIGEKYGCRYKMDEITIGGMRGEIPFRESMRRRLEILQEKGATLDGMLRGAEDTKLTIGALDILKETTNTFTHIGITGGLDKIIFVILNRYGLLSYFDRIYSSRYTGSNQIEPNSTVLMESKRDIIMYEQGTNGFNPSIFIFDGIGDAISAEEVHFPIAWNPKLPAAELTVKYKNGCVIRCDDLRVLLPIIKRWSNARYKTV